MSSVASPKNTRSRARTALYIALPLAGAAALGLVISGRTELAPHLLAGCSVTLAVIYLSDVAAHLRASRESRGRFPHNNAALGVMWLFGIPLSLAGTHVPSWAFKLLVLPILLMMVTCCGPPSSPQTRTGPRGRSGAGGYRQDLNLPSP